MAKILIKNGRVWDGEHFFFADVLTDGERVAKIEPNITDSADYTFDATGRIVSAGLVDTHVHMRVLKDDPYGIQAEMSCFPFGVTAAADAGRRKGEKAIMDSFMLKNVVFISAKIQSDRADIETLEAEIAKFGDKVVGIKVYFDTAGTEVSSIQPLAEVCAYATKCQLPVMVHCTNSPVPMGVLLNTLKPGDILTHCFNGGINHATEADYECMKAAQKRGIIIDTGCAGYVHTNFAVMQKAFDAGLFPDSISTDITKNSAYRRGGRYGMTMCMSLARTLGMIEEDIFKAVTSTPAKALGKEGEWGSLKVGCVADIAVLEYSDEGFSLTDKAGNHVESPMGYRCVLTVSDGLVVYRH